MGLRRSTTFFLLLVLVVAGAVVFSAFPLSGIRGSLLSARDIAINLRDRADTDHNRTVTAREVRRSLSSVIRGVIGGSEDINGDGSVNRTDMRSAVQGYRDLLAAVCGNGQIDLDEECDDGNTADGDGCSAACTREPEHLACSNFACVTVPGAGDNSCSDDSDCGPDYGLTVSIPPTGSMPVTPDHQTTFAVVITPQAAQSNMIAEIRFNSLYDGNVEIWETDSRCTQVNTTTYYTFRCPLSSVASGSADSFTFTLQPSYFPNCTSVTPTLPVTVVPSENRAYGSEPAPRVHRLTIPLQCRTSSDVTNIRPTSGVPVPVSQCASGKLGNGSTDFYFTSAWLDDVPAGKSYIFGTMTGNASGIFIFDNATNEITFRVFAGASRVFIRDAAWDPGRNRAYLLLQRFASTNNAFLGESVAEYDPVMNAITNEAPLPSSGFGYSSSPLRRAVFTNEFAYVFPVYYFNLQPIQMIFSYDVNAGTAQEVQRTSDPANSPLNLAPYPSAPDDVYRPLWRSCFLRSAKIPLR